MTPVKGGHISTSFGLENPGFRGNQLTNKIEAKWAQPTESFITMPYWSVILPIQPRTLKPQYYPSPNNPVQAISSLSKNCRCRSMVKRGVCIPKTSPKFHHEPPVAIVRAVSGSQSAEDFPQFAVVHVLSIPGLRNCMILIHGCVVVQDHVYVCNVM